MLSYRSMREFVSTREKAKPLENLSIFKTLKCTKEKYTSCGDVGR